MSITERIRSIREAEGLSQTQFAMELDINIGTLRNWEQGRRGSIGSNELTKITENPRFEKYALWLVTGKTAPAVGQVSPEIEQERDTG